MKLIWGLIFLFALPSCPALSESVQITGQINAWHDGLVKDRVTGQGAIDYAAEGYFGGRSSGLEVRNGTASYFFGASDYSVSLDEFTGQMVAESDSNSTTIDGNGSGTIRTKSYEGRPGALVSGFPTGEINGRGIWEIHAASSGRAQEPDPMKTNTSEGQPAENSTAIEINASSEFPL